MEINEPFIIPIQNNGSHISVGATKEDCFAAALRYLVKDGFKICGLKRTASGNHHDENWQDEYTVINDGGDFTKIFIRVKTSNAGPYDDIPILREIEQLSDDEITRWSLPFARYSGEEAHRYIYAQNSRGCYIFETSFVYVQTPDRTRSFDRLEWNLRKDLHTLRFAAERYQEETETADTEDPEIRKTYIVKNGQKQEQARTIAGATPKSKTKKQDWKMYGNKKITTQPYEETWESSP